MMSRTPEPRRHRALDPDGQLLLPLNRPETELIPEPNRERIIELLGEMMRHAIEANTIPAIQDER
ncbi:MAG: hypothetical protein WBE58_11245 [Verrucomicrobiales bacterium]